MNLKNRLDIFFFEHFEAAVFAKFSRVTLKKFFFGKIFGPKKIYCYSAFNNLSLRGHFFMISKWLMKFISKIVTKLLWNFFPSRKVENNSTSKKTRNCLKSKFQRFFKRKCLWIGGISKVCLFVSKVRRKDCEKFSTKNQWKFFREILFFKILKEIVKKKFFWNPTLQLWMTLIGDQDEMRGQTPQRDVT